MEQDKHETPVVFRKDRKKNPEITAVFPCEPADYTTSNMTCYVHIGQHGACSPQWYHTTRAATPAEYADLKAELESIGYRVKVYSRIQPWMRREFNTEQGRLNSRWA